MKHEKFLYVVNIPHHIASHVVGEHHTPLHRRIAGILVMVFGVGLAHLTAHLGNVLIALWGDLIGYSIHATGFLPFIHDLEKKKDQSDTKCLTC